MNTIRYLIIAKFNTNFILSSKQPSTLLIRYFPESNFKKSVLSITSSLILERNCGLGMYVVMPLLRNLFCWRSSVHHNLCFTVTHETEKTINIEDALPDAYLQTQKINAFNVDIIFKTLYLNVTI